MTNTATQPHLSVIIPAYNEARRIGATLDAVDAYLARQTYSFEVIVVDDGSEDETHALVSQHAKRNERVVLIEHVTNKGKGAAVRTGMLAAQGAFRIFMDADGATAIEEIEKLLPLVSHDKRILIGSRSMKGAHQKRRGMAREFLGWAFRTLVRTSMNLGVSDTQAGFKLFTQDAAERVFPELLTDGWVFDIEALLLAKKFGIGVGEVPIVWNDDARSTLRYVHMPRMLLELVRLRQKYARHVG